MGRISDPVNLADVRALARRRLPRAIFDIIDGGAGDEITLRANRDAFRRIAFRPRPLVDVSTRDLSVELFGDRISMPIMLAPTGAGRVIHPRAELEVARAAGQAGTIYMQSTTCAHPMEAIAAASDGPPWFQLYVPPSRDELEQLLAQVAGAGYRALAVAVDTPVFGNRERDRYNHVTLPFTMRPSLLWEGLSRPRWSVDFLRGSVGPGVGRTGNAARVSSSPTRASLKATQRMILAAAYPVTWDDLKVVRALWSGPLLVKGVMRPDECQRMVDLGVDGLVVSNHGGRQLDGVPATIEVLPQVVAAVGERIPVLLDGGIRRGVDVVKALALGARGVFVGRPYLFGLAWAGGRGVSRVLEMLRDETDRTLALLGCREIAEVTGDLVSVGAGP